MLKFVCFLGLLATVAPSSRQTDSEEARDALNPAITQEANTFGLLDFLWKDAFALIRPPDSERLKPFVHKKIPKDLPESFDARIEWPQCDSIGLIGDDGVCVSDWAISIASVISDRICIHSGGKVRVNISADDIMVCCTDCGGCDGGFPSAAWEYWVESGIVSGGQYGSEEGCMPFSQAPCEHYVKGSRPKCTCPGETPKCFEKCRAGYKKSYKDDKYYGEKVYELANNDEQVMTEIYKNGPVQALIGLYADLLGYKTGVYRHKTGKYMLSRSVKILGWGTEQDTPYWIVANSWNTDWGDKGFFKLARDMNETTGIIIGINAGIPKKQRWWQG